MTRRFSMGQNSPKTAAAFACVCAIALALALAGCSSNSASSGAAGTAGDANREQLLAELSEALHAQNYDSVSASMNMSLDSDLIESTTAADAEMDVSGDALRMHLLLKQDNVPTEVYVNGDDAVAIMNGYTMRGTVEDLGMQDFASIDALMSSQGASFLDHPETVESMDKQQDGDDVVYTVQLDYDTYIAVDDQAVRVSSAGEQVARSCEAVFRLDAQKRLVGFDMMLNLSGSSYKATTKLFDYDATTVPDAPKQVGAKASNADPLAGDVWAMNTSTAFDADGNEQSSITYDYDEHGNIAKVTMPTGTLEYEYDADGWKTSQVARDNTGTTVGSVTLKTERDDQGRVVKTAGQTAGGATVVTLYEYHANGMVKSISTEQPSGALSVETFDEQGLRTSQRQETDTGAIEMRFFWNIGDDGRPTGYLMQYYEDGDVVSRSTTNVVLDGAGNIAEVHDGETDALTSRIEWRKVESPSAYANLFYRLKR